jgi:poly(A) polymerase
MSSDKDLVQHPSPYEGRWVARLQGRIIAHGGTPEQALRAAQNSGYKEKPEIAYMPPASLYPFSLLTEKVRAALPDEEIYLVGGALRDALLGRSSHDFDFALPRNAIHAARRVASSFRADFYILDETYDTARVIVSSINGERDILDFAAFRGSDLESDLLGRDFTVNALAFDLSKQTILDPLNGASDIRSRIIRSCSVTSMQNDPIRILRAVRLAAALDFKIDPGTRKEMKQAAVLLPKVSPERKRDELFKILEGSHPDMALRAVEILGVLPYLLPELPAMKGVKQSTPHVKDVWEHTLSVIQNLDGILAALEPGYESERVNDLFTGLLTLRLGRYREKFSAHFNKPLNADRSVKALLFFAALYHDVSKPATKSVEETGRIRFIGHEIKGAVLAVNRARSFNLSNDEIERLDLIIRNHMRFHSLTEIIESEQQDLSRKAVYRFFRDTGEAGIDLVLLGLADLRGTRDHFLSENTWRAALDVARKLLENYWEKPQESVAPPRLLDGHDLIKEYKLEQGPLIGQLLEAVREEQATGKVSTREEAFAFAHKWLEENRK